MAIHSRAEIVEAARRELDAEILKVFTKHHLTPTELAGLLNEELADALKFILRRERHPNEPDKSADEE